MVVKGRPNVVMTGAVFSPGRTTKGQPSFTIPVSDSLPLNTHAIYQLQA